MRIFDDRSIRYYLLTADRVLLYGLICVFYRISFEQDKVKCELCTTLANA